MKVNCKIWLVGYFVIIICALVFVGYWVVKVDPFFHYHAPKTEVYYYSLDNERSQNNGIVRNFEYDGLITGTSMTENFKTSECDRLFGVTSIKVPFSGGSYKEINDNIRVALESNPNLRVVIRGLDFGKIIEHKDTMRQDLGEYPNYLYDNNIFNDVKYIFNRAVVFHRVYPMVKENDKEGFQPGITSFDNYSNWMKGYTFGRKAVCKSKILPANQASPVYLTKQEKEMVLENASQNIIELAKENPDVTFYYFFTPYSVVWWQTKVNDGTIYKQIEAEELIIEQILECSNIKLYSMNNLTDITTDLNNYKDTMHYGEWVNSLLLQYMKEDKCLLTKENYKQYIKDELEFYISFDYTSLNQQEDYDDDDIAAELLNKKYK